MKRIITTGCIVLMAIKAIAQPTTTTATPPLNPRVTGTTDSFYLLTPVEVNAVRAGDRSPFTKTNIGGKLVAKENLGQDLPFILDRTPSVVVNSDAGNGIGYTGIRIRGTDATRINVTLNGIPYNDAESQGTFFVDLPDFASSIGSIQIQRGVGTSSNGAGAFGASINLSTNETIKKAYAEINNSYGSFDSWKHTLRAGTGVVNGFSTDIRFSAINSNGYIDRAKSDLRSFYFSSAYTGKKGSLRLNVFSGKEKTYQSWNGISDADLKSGNRTSNSAGTEKPGDPYANETDNYTQTHYQLFFNHPLSKRIQFNTAFFFTKGKGYYEQYKAGEEYAKYGLPDPPFYGTPVTTTDLVRQLWLDNDFYGNIFSFQYNRAKTQATLGGAYTRYDGLHYGKVIWAEKGLTSLKHWYDLDALKTDFNIYYKQQTILTAYWSLFYDLQYRHVKYNTEGFRDNPNLYTAFSGDFFNPKLGVSYIKKRWKGYASFGIANKEPNRDDFEAGILQQPRAERLYNAELGIEQSLRKINWSATVYYMGYKDQLVLTGQINDVGAYTRTNIPNSYRAGIELQAGARIHPKVSATANITLSRNKVKNFIEYIDDYDNGGQLIKKYKSTDIAFSPAIISSATILYNPVPALEFGLINKYVSRQYLDNTENKKRSLDPFAVQDIRAIYTFKGKKCFKEISITGRLNNILDVKYEPNGYTFSYFYGGETVTENYYFPMAGRNYVVGLNFTF